MPFFTNKLQVLVLTVFFGLIALGSAIPKEEERNMLTGNWKLPSQLSPVRIEKLLNQFSQETFGKAFQFIGVDEDLFHGHVIFEKKEIEGISYLFPRAILYHTQEEAYKAHWDKTLDPKFDYLDVSTRNWIQWLNDDPSLDGTQIENAKKYLDGTQKDPVQFEKEKAEPQKQWHYTIHARNLDNKKLGFVLAGELQFEFHEPTSVNQSFTNYYAAPSGPIQVEIPGTGAVPLILTTSTIFIERSTFK